MQPPEQGVQGLGQSAQLIAGARHWQVGATPLSGQVRGPPPHPLDRAERLAGEHPPPDRRGDQPHRTDDGEDGQQSRQRIVPVAQGLSHDHYPRALAQLDRYGEQTLRVISGGRRLGHVAGLGDRHASFRDSSGRPARPAVLSRRLPFGSMTWAKASSGSTNRCPPSRAVAGSAARALVNASARAPSRGRPRPAARPDAEVDERAQSDENGRHGDREGEGQSPSH